MSENVTTYNFDQDVKDYINNFVNDQIKSNTKTILVELLKKAWSSYGEKVAGNSIMEDYVSDCLNLQEISAEEVLIKHGIINSEYEKIGHFCGSALGAAVLLIDLAKPVSRL